MPVGMPTSGEPTRLTAYLDHAATSPLHPAAAQAMRAAQDQPLGNASAVHGAGRTARRAVEDARERVAQALGVAPLEVLFTAGGTEADNLAVKGMAWARHAQTPGRDQIVVTAVEHAAVGGAAEWMARHQGFALVVVPPEADGVVDPERVLGVVGSDTALVSVMAVNNELGTIQPVDLLGPALAERGIPLHTDAVQALGQVPVALDDWHAAAASFSAHKVGGPTGVGVLVLRRDAGCDELVHGGGQERGLRSGTVDVAGVVGAAEAIAIAAAEQPARAPRLRALRDRLLGGLLTLDDVKENGASEARAPAFAHLAIAGCDTEALLLALDARGVAVSAGSACQSGATEPSHVLRAIGAPTGGVAHLRFSLGRTTTAAEIDHAVTVAAEVVPRLRAAGGGLGW